jgi:hypothetical protein
MNQAHHHLVLAKASRHSNHGGTEEIFSVNSVSSVAKDFYL